MRAWIAALVALLAAAATSMAGCSERLSSEEAAPEERVRALEAGDEIRALLAEYGATLDERDFAAFGRLFARDGEFVGGAGATARGPAEVAALLERLLRTNVPDSRGTNFHLVTNEAIDVRGDEATAVSKGLFVVTGADGRPQVQIVATYRDQFVREDGRWKFRKHEIQ
jgi:uncharacterized protein (TIGR02246 family)